MTLEPHKNITFVDFEDEKMPDDSVESVAQVHTELEMNERHPNYNKKALADLTKHVEAWQRAHGRLATIVGRWTDLSA